MGNLDWSTIIVTLITTAGVAITAYYQNKAASKQTKNELEKLAKDNHKEATAQYNLLKEEISQVRNEVSGIKQDIANLKGDVDFVKAENKFNSNGVMNLLRAQLVELHDIYVTKGCITSYELELWHDLYKSYHELGGNSFIESLRNTVDRLPTTATNKKEGE